ncbi:MAG: hypothetical protein ROO71_07170 [Balneola sp.]
MLKSKKIIQWIKKHSSSLSKYFWKKKKYLLLELILIVFGILIALWIGDYQKMRYEKEQARESLLTLKSELKAVDFTIKRKIDNFNQQIQLSSELIDIINSDYLKIDQEYIYRTLWNLRPLRPEMPKRGSLDDILETGKLSLIKSDVLRQEISSYSKKLNQDYDLQTEISRSMHVQFEKKIIPSINYGKLITIGKLTGASKTDNLYIPKSDFKLDKQILNIDTFSNFLSYRIHQITELLKSYSSITTEIKGLNDIIDSNIYNN